MKFSKGLVWGLMAAAFLILLSIPSVRLWASVEGDYVYHCLVERGPLYVFKPAISAFPQGIFISTSSYAGASQLGVPTITGSASLNILGPETSAARTACASGIAGQIIYDTTVNSLAFCDGTVWHKLVTGSGANDYWTTY